MPLSIRLATKNDLTAWSLMRAALWPKHSVESHLADLKNQVSDPRFQGFVAEDEGALVGFAEASQRDFANGCDTKPVAFLEGIWVVEHSRRAGVGQQLVAAVEAWAKSKGLKELASDTETGNAGSVQAHSAWGFKEKVRTVCFCKKLAE
jgi:aminoglycoside 6'-N-acetyltransferase I